MKCNRAMVKNAEKLAEDDPDIWVYEVRTQFEHAEDAPAHFFPAREIELMRNGWIRIALHDDVPDEFFPEWRVVALEGGVDG